MTEEQRIEWLLEYQQHPEQLSEEQLQQILADDEMRQLVQQLGFAKRAFKHEELKNDTPNVDAEWEKFAACHAQQDTPGEGGRDATMSRLNKIAASFVGVLLVSGIAFAAIQMMRHINTPELQMATTEQATDIKSDTSLSTATVKADTILAEPYIFNNVTLDSMLTSIAAVHGVQVVFENDTARVLRFHFVWKREDSLARIVEKLNTFEAVNIAQEDKTLVVR